MSGELFYRVNEWVIFGSLFALILSATEIGFQLGRRVQPSSNEPTRSHNATIEAAALGLLALLLGFTFSMAMSRYETRKRLVIEEANAIGTTFLRAGKRIPTGTLHHYSSHPWARSLTFRPNGWQLKKTTCRS